MPQAGSEIHKNVSLRERTDLNQAEGMADGRGLIEDHLACRAEIRLARLAELENTAEHLVPVVIGQAGSWGFFVLPIRRTLNPPTECIRLSAMHYLRADGVVKLRIDGFESRAKCLYPG